jgi:hypothetical protein
MLVLTPLVHNKAHGLNLVDRSSTELKVKRTLEYYASVKYEMALGSTK